MERIAQKANETIRNKRDLCCLGGLVHVQFKHDAAHRLAINGDVEEPVTVCEMKSTTEHTHDNSKMESRRLDGEGTQRRTAR
jgi:hypothetical protein